MSITGSALRAARTAAGVSLSRMAGLTNWSKSYLGHVETGKRPVSPEIVSAYEESLGVRIGDVSRVGSTDVELISQATDVLTAIGLRHGGLAVADMSRAQWSLAATLLDRQMTDSVRQRLSAQAGRLADRAAWSLADAGRAQQAQGMYRTALKLSTVDPDLESMVLIDQASHLINTCDPSGALDSLAALPSRSAVLLFSAGGVRAQAYAVLGDWEACVRSVGQADDAWSRVDLDNIPEYHRPYVSGHSAHAHNAAGKALATLAQQGHRRARTLAVQRLQAAIDAFGPERARAVARCQERLAALVG